MSDKLSPSVAAYAEAVRIGNIFRCALFISPTAIDISNEILVETRAAALEADPVGLAAWEAKYAAWEAKHKK